MTVNLTQHRLGVDEELRFEVGGNEAIMELVEGDGELFGTPLCRFKKYAFPPGFRAAVYAFKSASIEIVGPLESVYVANAAVPMIPYRNVHAGLNELRKRVAPDTFGPRVMIAGPKDVGKSTLCRLLGNYAVRTGFQSLYVDLDPGQYGSLNPLSNQKLYDLMMEHVAEIVKKKMSAVERFRKGGVIIDSTAFSKGNYFKSLVKAARVFDVTLLIVLDHERLYADLTKELPSTVKVIHLPKSGGVESRTPLQESDNRRNLIQKYFYGTKLLPFFPRTFEFIYDKPREEWELKVARIGVEPLPASCLPFGMAPDEHQTMVEYVNYTPALNNRVVALVEEVNPLSSALLKRGARGFALIKEVDTEKKLVIVLLAEEAPIKFGLGILSEVEFQDDMPGRM